MITIAVLAIAAAVYAYTSRRPDAPSGDAAIESAPESVAVITAPVVQKPIAVRIEALGTAHANEAVDITSKAGNKVIEVRFDEGQWVRRGEVLVELDGAQDRAELAAAEAALAESRSAYERSRGLFTQQAVSRSQLEQIEATQKGNAARVASAAARVADTVIRAPFDGRVGLRRVSVGALVSPGAIITTLDDTRTMKIDFDVPETFLAILLAFSLGWFVHAWLHDPPGLALEDSHAPSVMLYGIGLVIVLALVGRSLRRITQSPRASA